MAGYGRQGMVGYGLPGVLGRQATRGRLPSGKPPSCRSVVALRARLLVPCLVLVGGSFFGSVGVEAPGPIIVPIRQTCSLATVGPSIGSVGSSVVLAIG